jgi:hypothetical protein
MSSQFVVVVRDFRDAPTVTSEIEPMDQGNTGTGLDELNAKHAMNQGDAWAACAVLERYFGEVAVGSRSANITVLDATSAAFATVTSSGANVSNGDTLTIGGVVITFVTAAPVGSQVQIGPSAQDTLQNLVLFINRGGLNDALAGIAIAQRTSLLVVTLWATLPGTAGNSTTLAKSAASLTISGATFTGGLAVTSQHVISAGL